VRGRSLSTSMSDYLIKEIEPAPNIEVRFNTSIVDGGGDGRLKHLVLKNSSSELTETVSATALFVLIGAEPRTNWLPEEIERDGRGYVLTDRDLLRDGRPPQGWPTGRPPLPKETSMPGVSAVGDVRHGSVFINAPLAVVVLAITRSREPESRDPEARRLDLSGAALAAVGLGGVVFGLLESSRSGLGDPQVVAALMVGAVALAAFLIVERRSREPMMPLSLFRSRNFSAANAFTLPLYFALVGTLFYLPFDLIWVHGYSATVAGAAVLPTFMLMAFLSRYTGGLTDRYGPRLPLVVGPAIAAVGFAQFAVPGPKAALTGPPSSRRPWFWGLDFRSWFRR
jgi:hypothetical protein